MAGGWLSLLPVDLTLPLSGMQGVCAGEAVSWMVSCPLEGLVRRAASYIWN